MEPLFLNPYFRPKIWGGRKLKDIFNYDIPDGKVGEAWIISGYKDDASTVTDKFQNNDTVYYGSNRSDDTKLRACHLEMFT